MPECVFCRIGKKELAAELVYESEEFVAFNDIDPVAPVHVLIVPKSHFRNVLEMPTGETGSKFFEVVSEVAKKTGVDSTGFRVVFNTGRDAMQSVEHFHVHLIGGRSLSWPPG